MGGRREVVEACLAAAHRGEPGVLVTVVDVAGSTYRRPGARMFLPRGGRPVGLVSGGCLESDLFERAAAVLTADAPQTVLYDMRSPDDVVWGLGLGCNGAVRVLLEPVGRGAPPADLAFIRSCDVARRPGVVVTVFESSSALGPAPGERMLVDAAGGVVWPFADEVAAAAFVGPARQALATRRSCVATVAASGGRVTGLVEAIVPSLRLVVCGAGLDAVPVVAQAAALGWDVVVLDHRPAYARPALFPGATEVRLVTWDRLDPHDAPLDERTAVVVMTHHFLHDLAILTALVPRAPAYLGLLGPRKRAQNLLEQAASRGVVLDDALRRRTYGPIGLDVGAETPEEIALSLVAEIQSAFAGRTGGSLRNRRAPLHDWTTATAEM